MHPHVLRDHHSYHPAGLKNSCGPSNHLPFHPTHDLECSYLRDAHTIRLVVERRCVVVHISNLDIHLPCDHLGRDVQGSALSLPSGLSPPMQPRDLLSPGTALLGPQGPGGHSPLGDH